MKKWFTIGLFKDGVCVESLRCFQLPVNNSTLLLVDSFTALFAKQLKDIIPDKHYIAFDYEGRK